MHISLDTLLGLASLAMAGMDAWATLFQRLTFRCRCRSLADALLVERLTEAGPEEVLHVWVRTDYHG